MGIIAWRLFWLMHINRQMPEASCTIILADHEWKALYTTIHRRATLGQLHRRFVRRSAGLLNLVGFWVAKAMVNPVSPLSGAAGLV